ncbi:MAG: TetR/AcrR family transcriptional regulator [Oscillospiraceae bacterium]|nr:TetR/AcrR family transcriptional regulator [Oscillospiraceae bacterium]
MPSLEYKRNRILETSSKLFMAYGFKRVSMEEIARNAGVGKGTVYQLFESKQDLMFTTIEFVGNNMNEAIGSIMANETFSPITKLQMFLKTLSEWLSLVRTETLKDFEINFPEAFEKIQQTRQQIIIGNLIEMLNQGKQAGVYDAAIDAELAAHILIGAANHFTQGNVLSKFNSSPEQIFRSILNIILKGCITPEYRDRLQ